MGFHLILAALKSRFHFIIIIILEFAIIFTLINFIAEPFAVVFTIVFVRDSLNSSIPVNKCLAVK